MISITEFAWDPRSAYFALPININYITPRSNDKFQQQLYWEVDTTHGEREISTKTGYLNKSSWEVEKYNPKIKPSEYNILWLYNKIDLGFLCLKQSKEETNRIQSLKESLTRGPTKSKGAQSTVDYPSKSKRWNALQTISWLLPVLPSVSLPLPWSSTDAVAPKPS